MRRSTLALLLVLTALFPTRLAWSQTYAPFPQLDDVREWLWKNHPNAITGDSGVNAAIVVIDTNAHFVKGMAFRLADSELAVWQGAVARAISFQDDTVSKNLLGACADRASASRPAARPICVQDGARVQTIDGLRFLASRDVDVLKRDAASKRFGPDATNGAVVVATDTATFERYKSVGATSASLISFEGRRIRRRADGESVVITVLMLRATSKGPER